MSTSTRWTIAVLVVLVALGTALWRQLGDDPVARTGPEQRDVDTAEALAAARADAGLTPCPAPVREPGAEALRGITVECAADGSAVDVARAVAGRPVVLNLWAYWCAPCREELPALAEYQDRVGPEVMVLTVHQDENEAAALALLSDLGVALPTLQDHRRLIAAALKVPNVMPATVLLRPDGSVAEVLPRAFDSADEIAAAVADKIGPRTGESG